jgi:hypothetical protein
MYSASACLLHTLAIQSSETSPIYMVRCAECAFNRSLRTPSNSVHNTQDNLATSFGAM